LVGVGVAGLGGGLVSWGGGGVVGGVARASGRTTDGRSPDAQSVTDVADDGYANRGNFNKIKKIKAKVPQPEGGRLLGGWTTSSSSRCRSHRRLAQEVRSRPA